MWARSRVTTSPWGASGTLSAATSWRCTCAIKDDRIDDIKFQTFGCGSAIATSSMITELVMGKTLDEALEVTRADVADALDGLPPVKMHCSNLAADALHDAIKNWRSGTKLEPLSAEEIAAAGKGCGTREVTVIAGSRGVRRQGSLHRRR